MNDERIKLILYVITAILFLLQYFVYDLYKKIGQIEDHLRDREEDRER